MGYRSTSSFRLEYGVAAILIQGAKTIGGQISGKKLSDKGLDLSCLFYCKGEQGRINYMIARDDGQKNLLAKAGYVSVQDGYEDPRGDMAKNAFEKAISKSDLKLSSGQQATARLLMEALGQIGEGEKRDIYIRGLSGSGKTALLQVFSSALEGLGVNIAGDKELEGHDGTTIYTRPANDEVPDSAVIIDHKGFTSEELQKTLFFEFWEGMYPGNKIDPKRVEELLSKELVPDEDEELILEDLREIVEYSFGSLELGRKMIRDILHDGEFRVEETAGDFIAKNVKNLRSALKIDSTNYDESSFREILSRYSFLVPDNLDKISRSIFHYFREKGSGIVERGQETIATILGLPPIEGIPFCFKASNSTTLYQDIYHRHKGNGDREEGYLTNEPEIDILVPEIPEDLLAAIKNALGISEDLYRDFEQGNRCNDRSIVPRMKVLGGPFYRKSGARLIVPTVKGGYEILPAYWDYAQDNYDRQSDKSWMKPSMFEDSPMRGLRKVFADSIAKPMLYFHSHEHSLFDDTVRLGISIEALMQHFGLPYIVSYPGRRENYYYVYNAEKERMEKVMVGYKLSGQEGRFNLDDLRKK